MTKSKENFISLTIVKLILLEFQSNDDKFLRKTFIFITKDKHWWKFLCSFSTLVPVPAPTWSPSRSPSHTCKTLDHWWGLCGPPRDGIYDPLWWNTYFPYRSQYVYQTFSVFKLMMRKFLKKTFYFPHHSQIY